MKTIPMLLFSRTCLHLQTCTHSKTTLAITHPNSMVALLNHGLPPQLYLTPQQSLSAISPPARFLKKLLKKVPNRMPVSRGMSTNLSLKYHPSSNSQKHTIVEPITQSTSPTSPPANTTVNTHPKLHQLHPSQAYLLIKSKP